MNAPQGVPLHDHDKILNAFGQQYCRFIAIILGDSIKGGPGLLGFKVEHV